jgi:hypothetical protein
LYLLKNPIVILGVFICFKAYQVYLSFANGEDLTYLPWLRLGSVVLLIIASYFAIKGNQVALWIMGILLIFNIFAVIGGLLLIPIHQYVLKFVAIILGGYFVYGGIVLIKQARASGPFEA